MPDDFLKGFITFVILKLTLQIGYSWVMRDSYICQQRLHSMLAWREAVGVAEINRINYYKTTFNTVYM